MYYFIIYLLLCFVSMIILGVIAEQLSKIPPNLPPGPRNWPIIGGLCNLSGKDPFKSAVALAKDYGPVMSLALGSHKTVFVNDYKLIKDASINPNIQGRPDKLQTWRTKFRVMDGVAGGIIHGDNEQLAESNKFMAKAFEQVGSKRMEEAILKEVDKIFQLFHLKEREGRRIDSTDLFEPCASNILWALLSARRVPTIPERHDATKIIDGLFGTRHWPAKTMKLLWKKIEFSAATVPFLLSPWVTKMAPKLSGWDDYLDEWEKFTKIMADCIEDHRRDPCPAGGQKDFIDLYLDEIDKCEDPGSIFYKEFGEFNLTCLVGDIMMGGVDTIAAVLNWILAIITPFYYDNKIMDKVHEELNRVMGKLDLVTMEHRPGLIYMAAFLKEAIRLRPPLPWGLPRRVTEDTRIGYFNVPKGTLVISNFFAAFQNEKIFPDPGEFRPERFLSEDGKEPVDIEQFLPFSTGLRPCPGHTLAYDIIFLLMANILNRFLIFPVAGPTIPPLDPMPHFFMQPQPFGIMLVQRFPYGR